MCVDNYSALELSYTQNIGPGVGFQWCNYDPKAQGLYHILGHPPLVLLCTSNEKILKNVKR